MKKLLQLTKFLAVTLVFTLFLLSPNATALIGMPDFDVSVMEGSFNVDVSDIDVQKDLIIGSAVVSLPEGETGTIDQIVITGPDGQREFGCENIKVENGTDLIKSCGGPAYLKAGKTKYQARGSNFQPNPNVKLGIDLSE